VVSKVEMAIRTCLYWPDGTRKKCSQSQAIERCREERRLFAQVLVENYNKDRNLVVCSLSLPPAVALIPGLHLVIDIFM
jgi:invasion protein IalB